MFPGWSILRVSALFKVTSAASYLLVTRFKHAAINKNIVYEAEVSLKVPKDTFFNRPRTDPEDTPILLERD